jgi:predicted P-loop ATPase
MLILEGPQGTGKSKALEILAVNPDWFSGDLPLIAYGKRMIEQLRGQWIIEVAELNGMRKADVEHLKTVLSRSTDRARLAYERTPTELLRQCVFIGSTNDREYFRSPAVSNPSSVPVACRGKVNASDGSANPFTSPAASPWVAKYTTR